MAGKKDMTRDDALMDLGVLKRDIFPYLHRDYNYALDMAIGALEREKNTELTEQEKKFLALAIQGLTLRQGPTGFDLAVSCAKKLGIEEYLREYLKSWIDYGQKGGSHG